MANKELKKLQMIDTEKMYINACNIKDGKVDEVSDLVHVLVRHNEREKAFAKISEASKDFESAHAGKSFMLATDDEIKEAFKTSEKYASAEIVRIRQLVLDLDEDIKSYKKSYEDYTKLGAVDKVFITLQARKAYNVRLGDWILKKSDEDKKGVDLAGAVDDFYKNNQKVNKALIVSIFNRAVGTEGDLFYGVKLKKSSFTNEQITHFFAKFSKGVVQSVDKDNNRTTRYALDKSKDRQLAALTDLFTDTLDDSSKYEVIKPTSADTSTSAKTENKEAEKSASTSKDTTSTKKNETKAA